MYFPPTPNPLLSGTQQVPPSVIYPPQVVYPPMPQKLQQQTVDSNIFMYPSKLQPYNDREFLCKTFNYKVPFIEAFLSLGHEQKLRFFLICESRRLTGQLNDKETYSQILEKIMRIVNPNYKKPQTQPQYKPISEEELKKKILEKEFEQKCEWELRKLGMGEYGPKNGNLVSVSGLGLNSFDDFGFGTPSKGMMSSEQQKTNDKIDQQQDEDEFVFQEVAGVAYESPNLPNPLSSVSITNTSQSTSDQKLPQTLVYTGQSIQTSNVPRPQQKTLQSEQDEWQDAEQIGQKSLSTGLKLPSPEQKVESIWDLQINEEDMRKSEPDIRQIFGGGKKNQEEEFGGFEQADVDYVLNMSDNLNNYSDRFFRHQQFRYETVAEVSNDWLLGAGGLTQWQPKQKYANNFHEPNQVGVGTKNFRLKNQKYSRLLQDDVQPNKQFILPSIQTASITDSQYAQNPLQFNISSFDVSTLLANNTLTSNLRVNSKDSPAISQIQQSREQKLLYGSQNNSHQQLDFIDADSYYFDNQKPPFTRQAEQPMLISPAQQPNLIQTEPQQQKLDEWQQAEVTFTQPVLQILQMPPTHHNTDAIFSTKTIIETINDNQPLSYATSQPNSFLFNTNFHQTDNSPKITQNFSYNLDTQAQSSVIDPFDLFQKNHSQNYSKHLKQMESINFDFISSINTTQEKNELSDQTNHIPILTATQSFTSSSQQLQFNKITQPFIFSPQKPIQTENKNQTKMIRKIIKPPSIKNIEIQDSNFSTQLNRPIQNFGSYKTQQQNYLRHTTNQATQKAQCYKNQTLNDGVGAFSKKKQLSTQAAVNISIVPSINLALGSSKELPSSIRQSPSIPSHMPTSSNVSNQTKKKNQNIISTYNKKLTYAPDSFRSSIRQMLTKSKNFSKPFSQKKKQPSQTYIQQSPDGVGVIEQQSMVDMEYGKSNQFVRDNNKVNALYSPKVGIQRMFSKNKNQQLDYAIEVGTMGQAINQFKDNKKKEQDIDDNLEALDQAEEKPAQNMFCKKPSSFELEKQPQEPLQINSQEDFDNRQQQRTKTLIQLSDKYIFKLPNDEISYLQTELHKNSFFFDKEFYLRLKQMLQKLSMTDELKHFFQSLKRSGQIGSSLVFQTSVFATQIQFLDQILQKLARIDGLNKKFTLAMEQDQEEELAEVVFKSKQLTFEVNEDGQVAKRIATLLIQRKCETIDDIDEETQKYKGVYYMLIRLVLQQPAGRFSPVSNYTMDQLQTRYNDSWSQSLSSQSHYLYTCVLLYLMHTQFNQLQNIKNISKTIFTYLVRQHELLLVKINSIKEISQKYAEPPQTIFSRLMQSPKMTEYLQGLGEIAGVAERLCLVTKKIGLKFDQLEFCFDKIAKTITQCRQLALKYNLLNHSSNELHTQSAYNPHLALILSMLTTAKNSEQIFVQMRNLLKQKPVCKVCLTPRNSINIQQGDFISNAFAVSSQSLGSRDGIEWCHFTCYNTLKIAFENIHKTERDD